mmetsp:Transcript_42206/g.99043  ORF Transcript_42206/g.99043 Transcript_42206/m.99043 type:complete len:438 (-) Transcript_42206:260-1573(-)
MPGQTAPRDAEPTQDESSEANPTAMRRSVASNGSMASSASSGGALSSEEAANNLDTASGNALKSSLQVMPGFLFHTIGGLAGAAALGVGWAGGTVAANVSGDSVADTTAFRSGFKFWLYSNGIWPKVLCESGPYGNDFGPLPKESDKRLRMLRSTPLIVSNHVSYLDTIILPLVLEAPKLVAMAEVAKWPLFGQLCKEMDMIWVDRSDPESRQAAKSAMLEHASSWTPGDRPLLVWPEGTTSNGKGLKDFKSGAFAPGQPIRPVIVKYTGEWDPANVNFREVSAASPTSGSAESEGYGDREWATQFFGHIIHTCTVLVCKPYIPSAEEAASPELYSKNVRSLMLSKLEELDELAKREADREKPAVLSEIAGGVDKLAGGVDEFISSSRDSIRSTIAPRVEEGRQLWASSIAPHLEEGRQLLANFSSGKLWREQSSKA